MGKVKNLEKKTKPVTEFDKKKPENRVKSLNDVKLKKKNITKSKDVTEAKNVEKVQKNKTKKKKILQQIQEEVVLKNANKLPADASSDDPDKLVKREIVKKAIIAVKDGVKKEAEKQDKKDLFDEELRLGLNVVAVKTPDCPSHARKM
jgi:hypothetical protein